MAAGLRKAVPTKYTPCRLSPPGVPPTACDMLAHRIFLGALPSEGVTSLP